MPVSRRVTEADYTDNSDNVANPEVREEDRQLESLLSNSVANYKEGSIINGTVITIERDKVIVDIGFKSEGTIALSEFEEAKEDINVGDQVEVMLEMLEDSKGELVLSKNKARKIRVWDEISAKYEAEEVVEGEIISKIKGGLAVDVGLKAFLPGSQIDLRPIKNLDKMLGQKYEFKIIKMHKKRGNIVLSRRALLEAARKISKEQALENVEKGKIVSGIVKNITDYGAFIDLGGMDGLLHITDMSWGRVHHPSELCSVGDSINVMVLNFDKENEKIALGLKQTLKDPWVEADKEFPPATEVKGKVVSITDYGAFVELHEGIEGLVHISEMSWNKNIRHPNKLVSVGDIVDAVVLSIDSEKKRISLGMKQIQENPWDRIDEKYQIGSIVEGTVRNLVDFGAFVELEEGVDGLIHISDMSWTRKIKHPSEIVRKKDTVKMMVLSVDKENERVSLGLKQLENDPWELIESKYNVGDDLKCKVTKVINFGAFAELEEGVEGLIHVSQLSTSHVTKPHKTIRVDQEITAKIVKIDIANRKIALSIKAFLEGLSPEEVEKEIRDSEAVNADESIRGSGNIDPIVDDEKKEETQTDTGATSEGEVSETKLADTDDEAKITNESSTDSEKM